MGFSIGSILVIYDFIKNGLTFPVAILIWTIAIYGGLLGSRILFVLHTDPGLFTENLSLALVFWHGGLAWQGGPVLGTVAVALTLTVMRKPIWSTVGSAAPGLALCHALARVACLVEGCCYGAPTSLPWAIYSRHANAMVHPTQAYSLIAELCTALVLQLLWRKPESRKYLMPLYGVLLGSHRFLTEAFRGSPPGPELIPGLRFYQAISVLLIIGSLCLLALLRNRKVGIICTVISTVLVSGVFIAIHTRPDPSLHSITQPRYPYLVITRTQFVDTLKPWRELRESQGYEVIVGSWDAPPTSEEIRRWIQRHAVPRCTNILLIGDCQNSDIPHAPWHVPSNLVSFKYGQMFKKGVSDVLYGDLNGDSVPDCPVGRIPVRDKKELWTQLRKISRYEKQRLPSGAPRALVWTGAAGYQELMHEITLNLVREVPSWLNTFILSAYEGSKYYERPSEQPKRFLEELSKPKIIALMVGHGSFKHVQFDRFSDQELFFSVEDVSRLTSLTPTGPLFILACSSGDFSRPLTDGPCLAEAFLQHPGGPIAVISPSMSVDAMTNYFCARALCKQLTTRPDTVGEFLLRAQQKLHAMPKQDFQTLTDQDALAQRLMKTQPDSEFPNEPALLGQETLTLNLLGDPTAPLRLPPYLGLNSQEHRAAR